METYVHDGVTLAYERTGTPTGVPLLLLHGLSAAGCTYWEAARSVSNRADIFMLDFRGHGHSGRTPGAYVLEGYAGDVIAFLEGVVGRPARIAGHSLGGVVAFEVAAQRPDLVSGLLLEDPPLFFNDHSAFEASPFAQVFPILRDQMKRLQASGMSHGEVQALLAGQPAQGGGVARDHQTDESLDGRATALLLCDPEVWEPAMDGRTFAGFNPDAALGIPLTLLRADPALGAAFSPAQVDRLKGTNPQAAIHLVAGAPHGIRGQKETTGEYLRHLGALVDGA